MSVVGEPLALEERGVGDEVLVRDRRGYDIGSRLRFEFDASFPPSSTQEHVFEQVRPGKQPSEVAKLEGLPTGRGPFD